MSTFYFANSAKFAKFAVDKRANMIQELKIKNFKSFRDEAELSFEPSGEDRYNSVVTMPDGVQLLRFAVVLGANASGKSNLLDSIEFLRTFWNNIPATNNDGTDVQPFLMRKRCTVIRHGI